MQNYFNEGKEMTDKQIIIDGVDVAECQYLYFAIEDSIIDYKEYPRCSIGEAFTNNACKNSNCYYKKLKRKEQECKCLKEEKLDRQNALTEMINILYPNADDGELFTAVFNSEYIGKLKEVVEQLQAKEQELEQYKKSKQASYETMQIEWNEAKNEVKKLKAENEGLKDKNEFWEDCCKISNPQLHKIILRDIKLKAENYELKKQVDDLLHKPEIQNKIIWKIRTWWFKDILQKIKEVENEKI